MMGIVAFLAGLVFALGLGVGGMTRPSRVLAFLDVAGAWDPSLAFVMAGAVAVYAVAVRMAAHMERPVHAAAFSWPTRDDVDAPLVLGAAIFGVGWGLAGLCPGPALTAIASGTPAAIVFVAAMLAGMVAARVPKRRAAGLATGGVAVAVAALAPAPAMRPIAPDELRARPTLVVDVRTPEEYGAGHVPGARNIPVDAIAAHADQLHAEAGDSPIVLYCRSGRRAAEAARVLRARGVRKLRHLTGDWPGWLAAGGAAAHGAEPG
jgi:uncharacterized protein